MFRRPERIEPAAAGITVALLLYVGLLPLIGPGLAVDRIAVLAGASLTAFSVVAGSFLVRPSHRTVLLLLFLLELDVSVLLPLTFALPVNAAALVLTTLAGLSFGSSLADRVEVLFLGAANHSFVAHLESAKETSVEQERLMITRELHTERSDSR